MRLSGAMAGRFAFRPCEVDAGEAKRWFAAWQQGLARPPIAGHTPQGRPCRLLRASVSPKSRDGGRARTS
ncbi:hypothetical protein XFF1815_120043 [Xanthomonas citri pv. fuscans]|nr:hypothetical protein XFF7766_380001 [Xanthomonas citri pv. fuscans]SOO42063.1 hypothetical protein XFF1815_120043 [Xanthomonas citri pv. fuscans]